MHHTNSNTHLLVKVRGFITLTRPYMSLIAGLASTIALYICQSSPEIYLPLFLSNCFLFAGAMVINDWFDIDWTFDN